MPRKDINDNDLIHHVNFPNDQNVSNIEFAAGKSFFGKREFPSCYLTDATIPSIDHFMQHSADYENHDCHYLDANCDFNNLNLEGRSFDNIIFCNPYEVGFRGRFNTKLFLETAHSILNDTGKLIILGNSTNPWSTYANVAKHYSKLREIGQLEYEFEIVLETIDADHPYLINHNFYHCNLAIPTYPNQIITIKKAA